MKTTWCSEDRLTRSDVSNVKIFFHNFCNAVRSRSVSKERHHQYRIHVELYWTLRMHRYITIVGQNFEEYWYNGCMRTRRWIQTYKCQVHWLVTVISRSQRCYDATPFQIYNIRPYRELSINSHNTTLNGGRTLVLSLRTIFRFTRAIRHLFTRAWLSSGNLTICKTSNRYQCCFGLIMKGSLTFNAAWFVHKWFNNRLDISTEILYGNKN